MLRLQDIFYYHGYFPVLKGVRLTEPRTEHDTKEHNSSQLTLSDDTHS